MMKVEDTAGQMAACAVAYDIFMGTAGAAECVKKDAITGLLIYDIWGSQYGYPMYQYVLQALKPYPVSFFRTKANCTSILVVFRDYHNKLLQLNKELLNV